MNQCGLKTTKFDYGEHHVEAYCNLKHGHDGYHQTAFITTVNNKRVEYKVQWATEVILDNDIDPQLDQPVDYVVEDVHTTETHLI